MKISNDIDLSSTKQINAEGVANGSLPTPPEQPVIEVPPAPTVPVDPTPEPKEIPSEHTFVVPPPVDTITAEGNVTPNEHQTPPPVEEPEKPIIDIPKVETPPPAPEVPKVETPKPPKEFSVPPPVETITGHGKVDPHPPEPKNDNKIPPKPPEPQKPAEPIQPKEKDRLHNDGVGVGRVTAQNVIETSRSAVLGKNNDDDKAISFSIGAGGGTNGNKHVSMAGGVSKKINNNNVVSLAGDVTGFTNNSQNDNNETKMKAAVGITGAIGHAVNDNTTVSASVRMARVLGELGTHGNNVEAKQSIEGMVGVDHKFNHNITGSIGAGVARQNFSNGEDKTVGVLTGTLDKQVNSKVKVFAGATITNIDSSATVGLNAVKQFGGKDRDLQILSQKATPKTEILETERISPDFNISSQFAFDKSDVKQNDQKRYIEIFQMLTKKGTVANGNSILDEAIKTHTPLIIHAATDFFGEQNLSHATPSGFKGNQHLSEQRANALLEVISKEAKAMNIDIPQDLFIIKARGKNEPLSGIHSIAEAKQTDEFKNFMKENPKASNKQQENFIKEKIVNIDRNVQVTLGQTPENAFLMDKKVFSEVQKAFLDNGGSFIQGKNVQKIQDTVNVGYEIKDENIGTVKYKNGEIKSATLNGKDLSKEELKDLSNNIAIKQAIEDKQNQVNLNDSGINPDVIQNIQNKVKMPQNETVSAIQPQLENNTSLKM